MTKVSGETSLEPKLVIDLNYKFRIPSYQRGYRWEREQVEQLLVDISQSNPKEPYYLQPIVVAPIEEEKSECDYDLIDGQQRLTTLYIIFKALEKYFKSPCHYSISYETRSSSKEFLENIIALKETDNRDLITETPDHLYMWHAYETVKNWLIAQTATTIESLVKALKERVKIIWYELPDTVANWKKFTDLNIGKIPLTNSELIKAIILQSKNFTREEDKDAKEYEMETLVSQWDQIERELADPEFWGFLTKEDPKNYPTKIDLLFDLVTGKYLNGSKDKLYTFYYFVDWFEKNKDKTGLELWQDIYLQYQRLYDWYHDRYIYHRLGYLISVGFPNNALAKIFRFAHPKNPKRPEQEYRSTDRIKSMLDKLIKLSIRIPKEKEFENVESFRDLKYNISVEDDKVDRRQQYMIIRYLTLYNVMLTEQANTTLRYPFFKHNSVKGGWSLEHIHAQNSETLNTARQWKEWIDSHLESLKRISDSEKTHIDKNMSTTINTLIRDMELFSEKNNKLEFNDLSNRFKEIMNNLSDDGLLYQDEMGNMALLGKDDNSVLNNSTFDVKRQKIIQMAGTNFVPIGTERVFLKTIMGEITDKDGTHKYSCDTGHLCFWGEKDREAYLDDIEVNLKKYLQ